MEKLGHKWRKNALVDVKCVKFAIASVKTVANPSGFV